MPKTSTLNPHAHKSRPDPLPPVEFYRYEEILYSMLPGPLCTALKSGEWNQGHEHKSISLLMTDVVGYKTICQNADPSVVMTLLDDLYTLFDSLVFHFSSLVKSESHSDHSLTKIESFSDHYVACGGLHFNDESTEPSDSEAAQVEHLEMLLTLAMAMLEATLHVTSPLNKSRIKIRIGIHTGPCTTGIVGVSLPRLNLFGDLVQQTHELEASSLPGVIQVPSSPYTTFLSWFSVRIFGLSVRISVVLCVFCAYFIVGFAGSLRCPLCQRYHSRGL